MKKRIPSRILCLCLALLFLLCGCARTTDKISGEELTFPGTEWNMSPEEVRTALEVSEVDWEQDTHHVYHLSDWQVLGHSAEVTFYFRDFMETGHWGLYEVFVYFPDGTSTDDLLAELTEQLGEGTADENSFVWNSAKTVEDDLIQLQELIADTYTGTPEEMEKLFEENRSISFGTLRFAERAAECEAFIEDPRYGLDAPERPALLFRSVGTSLLQQIATYQEP